MTKRLLGVAVVMGLVAGGLAWSLSATADEKKKGQSTKAIMKLCFDDEEGLLEVLGTMVKEPQPKWEAIAEKSHAWVGAAEDLGKNKPKKGEAGSWEKLTKKWLENAQSLEAGAKKKDAAAVSAALKYFETSCKACHSVHK